MPCGSTIYIFITEKSDSERYSNYLRLLISCIIVLVLLLFIRAVFAQSNVKTWTETLVQDFSDNQLFDLIITNNSGGEIQFPHPLVQTTMDYNDESVLRNLSKDSAGNFVHPWVQDANVYVQKYSADGEEVSPALRVNDVDHSIGENIFCTGALMNDGTYLEVWINTATDNNMCGQLFKDDSVRIGANFVIKAAEEHNGYGPEVMSAPVLIRNKLKFKTPVRIYPLS